MEEEDIKRERETRLTIFRITICEANKAKADEELKAAEKALLLQQRKLEQLGYKAEDRLWAKAFEDGTIPNYEMEKRLKEGTG